MAAAAHTLSSSDDSEDDFSVGPDLATRLKARLEPRPTLSPVRRHQTATEPTRTASHDIFNKSNSKGVTEEIEIISSDEEEGTENYENEDDVTFVSEEKSPSDVGGGCAKRPRVAGYDSTTEEEELPDVLPISPINCKADDDEAASDCDSLPCDVGPQQASLGKRGPFANGRYQPVLTDQVFGRAAVQSSCLASSQTIGSPSPPPPLSKADAKKRDVERRKQERERIKRDRLQEKERAKEMKELEKVAKKANSLAECTKWMAVRAAGRLCASPAGSRLAATVSGSDLQWHLQADPIVEEAVTFARVDPRSKQETPESLAIVILDSEPFMRLVRNQQYPPYNHISNGTSTNSHQSVGYTLSGRTVVETNLAEPESFRYNCTLEEQCKIWKELLSVKILSIFVWGLDEHFKKNKCSKTAVRGRKSKGNDQPEPNRLDVETALTTLQIMQRVDHRMFSDALQLAEYVVHLARAASQAPYKREQLDDGAMFSSWYAEGSNVVPVKVTPTGVGLRKLWQQQLRQFISVGLETAQAIADAYPSPKLLLEAYEGLSSGEGSRLLADIPVRRGAGPLQTTRRLGPELSKKVHTFFTSTDPDRVLGS